MSNMLISTGLVSCLAALAVQLFPDAAFRLGADPAASWLVFGFGIFLIVAGGRNLHGRTAREISRLTSPAAGPICASMGEGPRRSRAL
ncbi:hypothetical protein [Hyphococcus luteus]|nr:hypothetical protein [Marinicaulis flavus]